MACVCWRVAHESPLRFRRTLAATVAAGSLVLLSCGGAEESKSPTGLPTINIGSAGGMTGMRKGCQIDSAGVVTTFQAFSAGADSHLSTRKLTADEGDRLRAAVAVQGAQDWHSDERGNLTSWAQLMIDSTSQRWTWSGNSLPESAPKEFVDWLIVAGNLCKRQC